MGLRWGCLRAGARILAIAAAASVGACDMDLDDFNQVIDSATTVIDAASGVVSAYNVPSPQYGSRAPANYGGYAGNQRRTGTGTVEGWSQKGAFDECAALYDAASPGAGAECRRRSQNMGPVR